MKTKGRLGRLGVTLFLIGVYVGLSNEGHHHWHEPRYLYSASFFSTAELMQGAFDPGPAPVRAPEIVAAWYVTELFHVFLLNKLVQLFGMGLGSYTIIKSVYGAMLLISLALTGAALQNVQMAAGRISLILALILLSPVFTYLGFKLLGEVPSLMFAAGSLFLYTTSLRLQSWRFVLGGLAGVCLALSGLSSARMPLLFLGFWVALLSVGTARYDRKAILHAGLITWVICLLLWPIGLGLLGGSFGVYLHAVKEFLHFVKPIPQWAFLVFNLWLFGMIMWPFLLLAWTSHDNRGRLFFLVWLLVSTMPALLFTMKFMEARYLITGLIPFVGLATLGIESVWRFMQGKGYKRSLIVGLSGALFLTLVGESAVASRIIPYETEAKKLIRAVVTESPSSASVAILIPWGYSDFHLLRFLFPEKSIYLVESAFNDSGQIIHDPAWASLRAETYARRYLPNAEALCRIPEDRKVYLGWTILPSSQNLHNVLMTIGLKGMAQRLEMFVVLNHQTRSWLWQHPQFRLSERARYGQYQVYQVTQKAP